MRRRDFGLLVCAATVAPTAVLAQATSKQYRVGWLLFPAKDAPLSVKYIGDFSATLNAVALKKATNALPIVVAALADPIELGLIQSYSHPGGNVTGIMPYVNGLPTKQLELARELIPGATRIGLIDDVTDPKAIPQGREIKAAGEKMKIRIIPGEVRTAADIAGAYETFSTGDAEVVVVEQSSMLVNAAQVIAEAAAAKKLPTLYGYHEHVEAGGLISYGVNLDWCFRRAAYFVDRILKGARRLNCLSSFQPHWSYGLIVRLPTHLASRFHPTCSFEPTTSSNR